MSSTSEVRPSIRLEPKRRTAERFGVCTKTLDRWVERGILAPPKRVNGRDYFSPDCQPANERA